MLGNLDDGRMTHPSTKPSDDSEGGWMRLGGMRLRDVGLGTQVFMTVIVIAVVYWFVQDIRASFAPSQFSRYSQDVYYPEKGTLCPGETLVFTPTLIITKAPVVLELTTTFFEDDPPHSVGPRDLENSVQRSIQLSTGERTTAIRMVVPDLPPADDYRVIRALENTQGNSVVSYTSVPFAVSANCP